MIELQHIIESKREVLSRETYSRTPINYSEGMSDDQKDRFIQYLAEQHQEDELTKRAMQQGLEDFMSNQKLMDEKLASMEARQSELEGPLAEERKLRKTAERKRQSLQEKLDYAHQERFGDRRQRVRKRTTSGDLEKSASDRENEKDNFDGTPDSLRTDSIDGTSSPQDTDTSKQERDLSNRPDEYKKMGVVGDPVFHPSDLSKVRGSLIERKTVQVFSLHMSLVEERFEMVHYAVSGQPPQWGYFPTEGHPEFVTKFEGTKATPEFLQALAYEVYVKNVTFGLLHQWLTDMGMTVSSNTLHNWLKKGKKHLDKLVCVLKTIALEKDSIVNCDETWCKVRKYDHYKKCYIWFLMSM